MVKVAMVMLNGVAQEVCQLPILLSSYVLEDVYDPYLEEEVL